MKQGILTVISGFSGVGKGTAAKLLIENFDDYVLSVSATTRSPRPGEVDGREYFFVSKEEFEEMIEKGLFFEYAQYVNNYYGTPRQWVEQQLSEGRNVILEIDCQGGLQIKKLFPEAVLIFVGAPSVEEINRRLHNRGSETEEQIKNRLLRACDETVYMDSYDYIVISRQPEQCASDINTIVKSEQNRIGRSLDLIADIKADFAEYKKGE